MDIDDLLGLRRRRDPRPTPVRLTEQLPAMSQASGTPRSKTQEADDLFGRLDNELFTSAITGEPTRADRARFDAATMGKPARDDPKDFADSIS